MITSKMRIHSLWLQALLAIALAFNAMSAQAVTQNDPGKMVQELSDMLIAKVSEQRAELQESPEKVMQFAKDNVLPYVAEDKMARFAMGVHWRSATEKQRVEFTDAFINNLIRSYSSNFLKFEVVSASVDQVTEPKPGRAEISSTVKLSDGQALQLVYRAFQDKDSGKWLLYDFTFNNISTLVSFRNVYGGMIDRQGVDAVIQELRSRDATADASSQ
ncbi:ABC transporter substrate-binding protein [Thiomicrorhabdus sp. 6S2-11]|uniref:ABC transporter substrate-binding protein n=1 Tax=Thiomicrorhabdus marina TaxID=2818442 RepID=A0ABS3Q2F1_9GAMM|nr:ABC transporter substrate-binding protein [Thiomicrorhabdus marina]MBO1926288.1 ABC transporter substrate-binding protein [Thiomicrorhabdus marina]